MAPRVPVLQLSNPGLPGTSSDHAVFTLVEDGVDDYEDTESDSHRDRRPRALQDYGLPLRIGAGAAASAMGADGDGHPPAVLLYVGPLGVSLKGAIIAALFAVATLVYQSLEQLSWVDAAYCATGVITTVGQVIVPVTRAGRLFTAVLNVLSLGAGVLFILEVADARRASLRRALAPLSRGKLGSGSPAFSGGGGGGGGVRPGTRLELAVLGVSVVPSVMLAAGLLQWLEGWPSYVEALYFAVITASGGGNRYRIDCSPDH